MLAEAFEKSCHAGLTRAWRDGSWMIQTNLKDRVPVKLVGVDRHPPGQSLAPHELPAGRHGSAPGESASSATGSAAASDAPGGAIAGGGLAMFGCGWSTRSTFYPACSPFPSALELAHGRHRIAVRRPAIPKEIVGAASREVSDRGSAEGQFDRQGLPTPRSLNPLLRADPGCLLFAMRDPNGLPSHRCTDAARSVVPDRRPH